MGSNFSCRLGFSVVLLGAALPLGAAEVPPEIEDASVNSRDRLPPRIAVWPAPDVAAARASSYERSPWVRSLNGRWRFHWSPEPRSRPQEFYRPDFDVRAWGTIDVPSTWERQGHGVPLYVNTIYPFKVDPPRVMGEPPREYTTYTQRDPVGSYRTSFELPREWTGKRIVLHFAGVSSAFFVWVNGRRAGYSEDSRLPAEFDVTALVRPGQNLLAVEVYKYCDGSYLEDQDFWRLAGIFRDVFVRAVPSLTLWDVYAQPVLDEAFSRGRLVLHATPANFTAQAAARHSVSVLLLDPRGRPVGPRKEFPLADVPPGFGEERGFPPIECGPVETWSAEEPAAYTALVELRRGGSVVEAYALPVGFRRLEIRGRGLALNGRELKIRGVNRHEFDPDQAYAVPPARRLEDLRLMKQANIDFVRNSHYPSDPRWYTLTSGIGMMVLDEANVESHGLSYLKRVLPGDDPVWSAACVERMRRMVIRDRQFPSVVMWSLGNEAGWGNAFLAMRSATLAADPEKRLIQYADMNRAADLDSQTYPTTAWLREHVAGRATRKGERGEEMRVEQHGPYPSGRPFLMNEYAHAMGNSVGNLRDYWELIHAEPMLVGGFIWDWVDQALWRPLPGEKRGFVYGGDFGDQPNNRNSCCDGLIAADRIPHPHYYEVQKIYQPVDFNAVAAREGAIQITNRHLVRNLSAYRFEYAVEHDGRVIREGALPAADVAPGATRMLRIFDRPLEPPAEGETFLTVRMRLEHETPWAPAGHVVAWEQFLVSAGRDAGALPAVDPTDPPAGVLRVSDEGSTIRVAGADFTASFDRETGLLAALQAAGRDLVVGAMRFNFWRALTDNDLGWRVGEKMAPWRTAGHGASVEDVTAAAQADGTALVDAEVAFAATGAHGRVRHVVHPDGTIDVTVRLELSADAPEPPRLGVQCEIAGDLGAVEWFGRGPHESYRDRLASAAVGRYRSSVAEWITPYVRPQENANRSDVRFIRFAAGDGRGLEVRAAAASPLSVSAWPYTQDDLETAKHDYELPRRDRITLNLDHLQMGVGGDNSWGAEVHREYRIATGKAYQWSFRLQAVRPLP